MPNTVEPKCCGRRAAKATFSIPRPQNLSKTPARWSYTALFSALAAVLLSSTNSSLKAQQEPGVARDCGPSVAQFEKSMRDRTLFVTVASPRHFAGITFRSAFVLDGSPVFYYSSKHIDARQRRVAILNAATPSVITIDASAAYDDPPDYITAGDAGSENTAYSITFNNAFSKHSIKLTWHSITRKNDELPPNQRQQRTSMRLHKVEYHERSCR
jgi:hypothetical protein